MTYLSNLLICVMHAWPTSRVICDPYDAWCNHCVDHSLPFPIVTCATVRSGLHMWVAPVRMPTYVPLKMCILPLLFIVLPHLPFKPCVQWPFYPSSFSHNLRMFTLISVIYPFDQRSIFLYPSKTLVVPFKLLYAIMPLPKSCQNLLLCH